LDFTAVIIFILVGVFAGTLAGLIGIGGGVIYVPVLIWYLEANRLPGSLVPLVSVSTSLGVIVFSLLNGSYAHFRNRNFAGRAVLFLMFGGAVGALLMSFVLVRVHSGEFKLFLGLFQLAFGVRFLWPKKTHEVETERHSTPILLILGLFAGGVSSFFGVGGGLIVVPILHLFLGFRLVRAIGTASGFMIFSTSVSLISYLSQSRGIEFPSEGFFGSLYLPAFFAILPSAFIFSRVGANLAHRLDGKKFSLFFGVLIIGIALRNIVLGVQGLF